MKIIFITREGYALPGARIRCYNFARELKKYGLDTEVLSFADTLGAMDGEKESRLTARDKIRLNYNALRLLAKEKSAILYMQRFNYHSLAPYLAQLFNKNKIIVDLDDWEMREDPRYYLKYYPSSKAHYLTRQMAGRSVFCIAASRFLETFLLEFNKTVYYIPSGVDTELFRPSLDGLSNDEIRFSWIGTLHRKEYIENIDFALSCFSALRKKYSHIYFQILGGGIYRDDLERVIARYNDPHIVRRDSIDPESVPGYLNTVHIGLFPVANNSKFNQAKSPTKLFEYMAMARPTVSSAIGEPRHIIRDGDNGFLAGTREEFAEKMERLITDPALRRRLGEKARENILEQYSLKVLGKRLYEIIMREDD